MMEDIKLSHQNFNSRGENLRGEYCYDPENKGFQYINRIKIAQMGFARAVEITDPVTQPTVPILGPTIVEKPVEEPLQEIVNMTPELRRMVKEKKKQAEENYERYISRRMKLKKDNQNINVHKLIWEGRNFIQHFKFDKLKENSKPTQVSLEVDEEEVDISAYKHFLTKDKQNSPENKD